MTPITRFEDIKAWQEARVLVNQVYVFTRREPFSGDYGLRNQLQRAAVSIMANIAEGFDCDSNNEFARFLGIARRSAAEVQSLLYASHDVGYLSAEEFKSCYDQAAKTKGLIGGLKRVVEKGQKSYPSLPMRNLVPLPPNYRNTSPYPTSQTPISNVEPGTSNLVLLLPNT